MSQVITLNVRDKIASCITEKPVVCGNSDYEIHFNFDEEWNGHEVKTAVFTVNGKSVLKPFSGTVCKIPELNNTLILWVGVFAGTIDDGTLSTSTPALVHCVPCATDGEHLPFPPPDDVYNQIVELCDEAVSAANDVEERADNGEFNGKDGADGKDGKDGADGADGKTAYQYAVDGGYEGSEEDFARDTASLTIAKESAEQAASNASTSEQNASTSEQNAIASAESALASADRANAILEDVAREADTSKKYANNVFANALKGHKSGQSVSASDVSPIEHELDVRVTGKNLMNTSCVYGTLIAASGKISAVAKASVVSEYIYLPTGNYIISYKSSVDLRGIAFYRKKNEESFVKYVWAGRPSTFKYSFAVDEDCFVRIDVESDGYVAIEDISTFFANNEVQLERGTTKTDYVPYFDVNGTKVNLFGKNLSRIGYVDLGTISPDSLPVIYEGYLPDGAYLSRKIDFTPDGNALFRVVDEIANSVIDIPANVAGTIIAPQVNKVRIEIVNYGRGKASEIQLELGNTKTEYELYKEPVTATADAEGNVKGLVSLSPNMTLITDNDGAVIDCTYNRDINKAFEQITQAMVSMGANI